MTEGDGGLSTTNDAGCDGGCGASAADSGVFYVASPPIPCCATTVRGVASSDGTVFFLMTGLWIGDVAPSDVFAIRILPDGGSDWSLVANDGGVVVAVAVASIAPNRALALWSAYPTWRGPWDPDSGPAQIWGVPLFEPATPPTLLSATGQRGYGLGLSSTAPGAAVAVWSDFDGSVVANEWGDGGWGASSLIGRVNGDTNAVAGDGAGNAIAAWGESGGPDIVSRWYSDGGWMDAGSLSAEGSLWYPTMRVAATGGAAVVAWFNGPVEDGGGIKATRCLLDGGCDTVATIAPISTSPQRSPTINVAMSTRDGGRAPPASIVAWQIEDAGIWAAIHAGGDDAGWGPVAQVVALPEWNGWDFKVAATATGGIFVAWQFEGRILVRRYDPVTGWGATEAASVVSWMWSVSPELIPFGDRVLLVWNTGGELWGRWYE